MQKRLIRNVKVFVLAHRNLSEEKTRIMDYGADEFAIKPLHMDSVIAKVIFTMLEDANNKNFVLALFFSSSYQTVIYSATVV